MKTVLRRIIAALLCVVLVAEAPAMAGAQSSQENAKEEEKKNLIEGALNSSTNVNSSRSEDVRVIDRAGSLSLNISDDERAEIFDLFQAEAGLEKDVAEELFKFSDSKRVGFAAYQFRNYLLSVKTGYFTHAAAYRDGTVINFARLTEFIQDFPQELRATLGPVLILSIMRWAFASVGAVTKGERDRVVYGIADLLQTMATVESNKALLKRYRSETDVFSLGFSSGMLGSVGFIFLAGSLANGIWGEAGIRQSVLPSLISFVPLVITTFKVVTSMSWSRRLKRFRKHRLDVAMASYLKTDFNPEIIRRIQARWKGVDQANSPSAASSIGGQGHSDEDQKYLVKLTISKLRQIMLAPVSQFQGIQEIFGALTDDPEATAKIDEVIEQDPELSALAQRGRAFRDAYRNSLRNTFGYSGAEFVTDPELEILKDLRVARNSMIETKFQELTLKQAEMRAWEETRARFGLPADLELSTLEEKRYDNPTYFPAYEFFRRAYFQAQQKETPRTGPVELDLNKFKSKVQDEVEKLRAANFIEALKTYQKVHPKAKSIKIRIGDRVASVAISDLVNSEIQFHQQPSYQAPVSEKEPRLNDPFITRFSWIADWGDKDLPEAAEFYLIKPVHPVQMRNQIVFAAKDGTKAPIKISEASFSRLLFEIGPKYAPLQQFDLDDERYLLEAARRDAGLANSIAFLGESHDRDASALEKRLSKKISNREKISENSKSLTEELRDNPHALKTGSLLNDLRWFGYAIHPDYWRVRDAEASTILLEKIDLNGKTKLAAQNKKLNELDMKWKSLERQRLSYKERVNFLVRRAAYTAGLIALLSGLVVGGIKAKDELLPWWNSRTGETPFSKKLRETFSSEMDKLEMDSADRATNHPQDEVDRADGADKNLFDIEIINRNMLVHVPTYLNLIDPSNLPKDREAEERRARWSNSGRLEVDGLMNSDTSWEESTFAIKSLVPLVARNSLLPLPSADGYRVSLVKLRDRGGGPTPKIGEDYHVYFDNRTGLSYIRFTKLKYGVFNVNVAYQPIEKPKYLQNPSWLKVDKDALAKVNQSLVELGATDLADKISETMRQTSNPDIKDIATAFRFSGTYTYDKEGYNYRFWSSNPFEPFRKFLRGNEFFYQCTGSNKLLNKYLQTYYQQVNSNIEVQNLVGFTFDWSRRRVSSIGHMHTLAFNRAIAYEYVEVDGTPAKMDPKYSNSKRRDSAVMHEDRSRDRQAQEADGAEQRKKDKDQQADQKERAEKESKEKAAGPARVEPWQHSVPNFYALRPAPLAPVENSNRPSAKGTPSPDPVDDDSNESDAASAEVPNSSVELSKIFEGIVAGIKTRLGQLRESDKSLGASSQGRRPGIQDLSLILPARHLFGGDANAEAFLGAMLKLEHHLPLGRELSAQEVKWLQEKTTEAMKAAGGKASVAIQKIALKLKAEFESAVEREKKKMDRPGSARREASKTAYLLDREFVQAMSRYYEFFIATDLGALDTKAKTRTSSIARAGTCQSAFAPKAVRN